MALIYLSTLTLLIHFNFVFYENKELRESFDTDEKQFTKRGRWLTLLNQSNIRLFTTKFSVFFTS